ncbi:hypothetical protein ACLESO_21710 [Pyxidicoccus sp. 3LG]
MKLSNHPLLVAAVFLLSASSGFAWALDRGGPSSLGGPCTTSLQCDRPWERDGECCAVQPLDPTIGVCAPREAGLPCLD